MTFQIQNHHLARAERDGGIEMTWTNSTYDSRAINYYSILYPKAC